MKEDIKSKKIELFAQNGIDKYRKNEDISVLDMMQVYLENNGFILVTDKQNNFLGYLDLSDIDIIKGLFARMKDIKDKSIKELIKSKEITLRTEKISADTELIVVLKKLENIEQNYFPVFRDNILLGRVSKKIIREKIDEIY